ncbi:uncharacterized protein LOC123542846 isoform X2 [Mercenaria mercenaria]|uniref:uncharacterized protein LOC123542846 isoform X2 n=1 Tax=Mercenaria mercenaria TaxID=6596 RepID=UPI00234F7746|nr:uncharacterized protein LOC123542846 isoform X2 [Mercenaria mercenaria]
MGGSIEKSERSCFDLGKGQKGNYIGTEKAWRKHQISCFKCKDCECRGRWYKCRCGYRRGSLLFCSTVHCWSKSCSSVALTGVAVAGGATSIGASVTNNFIEKGYMESVQEALDKDRKSFESLKKAIEEAKQITLEEGFEGAFKAGKSLPGGVKLGTSVARRLVVSEKAAASLLKLGNTAIFASHAVAMIALPLDIIFFVKDVIDLAKGNVSEAADKVFELADQLQKEYDEIMEDIE